MPKIVGLIQNNLVDPLVLPVVDYFNRHNIPYVDRSLTDKFKADLLELDLVDTKFLVYGSVGWTKHFVASQLQSHMNYSKIFFDASTWKRTLGEHYLNSGGSESDVLSLNDLFLDNPDTRLHIRPTYDDKIFPAKVFDPNSWKEMVKQRDPAWYSSCWISEEKEINTEYRCWVIDGKVIEISQYRKDNQHNRVRVTDPQLFEVVQFFTSLMFSISRYVIDIAETPNGYKVIEFNPIHCCGWYAADVDNVLNCWVDSLKTSCDPRNSTL